MLIDPRMSQLARNLVDYSCSLSRGERVLIEAFDIPEAFTILLVRECYRAGALPFVSVRSNRVLKSLYEQADGPWAQELADMDLHRMRKMDAYMGVRGGDNASELSDVGQEQLDLVSRHYLKPVHLDERVPNTKWVVLRWPSPAMAQQAAMSTEAFEDFFFQVCNLDYARLSRAMDPLVEWLEKTDRVRIVSPGTDLHFSIRNIPVVKCDGRLNIPDGEIYTAPVRDSVEGTIHYNTPTLYQGATFHNVRLCFRAGRIIEADAGSESETARLRAILDSDEGARYVGEFAIGLNPHIARPMKDILFDEKIMGSIHLTPGQAYETADNGNRSQIHWDLVLIQTKPYGGGELYFDDVLVRKDGRFVVQPLTALNPDQLAADQ